MRQHSLFSPSRLAMLKLCPSWVGKQEISSDAQRGIDLHEMVINAFMKDKNSHDYPTVDFALKHLYNIKVKYPYAEWQSELSLDTAIPHVNGYADIVGIDTFEDTGILIELKSGYTERPEARDSIQIKAYSLALLRQCEYVHAYMIEIDQRKITDTTFTRKDVLSIYNEIIDIIRASIQGRNYNAGVHCDYCLNSLICPAVENAVISIQSIQEAIDEAKNLSPKEVSNKLYLYWDKMQIVEKYWDNLKARAMSIIEAGGEVEGFTVKTSSGARKWTDEHKAITNLNDEGIDVSKVMTLQSPANVEKILKSLGIKSTYIKTLLSGLTTASERKQLIKKEVIHAN
ncbi:MAG: DUF2800 domain-containing protein [Thermodesulfovibrionales bacterium]|nr:DUF2800 domain-containing protein [Thermodesulfovibrionales bacterium]